MKSLSNKVKILILIGTFALAMCGSVIYGYLNTSDIAVNEFTSGNVNISITESAWNAEIAKDPEYAEHLYPEETITKDPAITNTGLFLSPDKTEKRFDFPFAEIQGMAFSLHR